MVKLTLANNLQQAYYISHVLWCLLTRTIIYSTQHSYDGDNMIISTLWMWTLTKCRAQFSFNPHNNPVEYTLLSSSFYTVVIEAQRCSVCIQDSPPSLATSSWPSWDSNPGGLALQNPHKFRPQAHCFERQYLPSLCLCNRWLQKSDCNPFCSTHWTCLMPPMSPPSHMGFSSWLLWPYLPFLILWISSVPQLRPHNLVLLTYKCTFPQHLTSHAHLPFKVEQMWLCTSGRWRNGGRGRAVW